jgi:hypothetical protein
VCASAFIVGSNAGYTMYRGSVKGTGYPLHSAFFPLTCPSMRYRVPSHFNCSLHSFCIMFKSNCICINRVPLSKSCSQLGIAVFILCLWAGRPSGGRETWGENNGSPMDCSSKNICGLYTWLTVHHLYLVDRASFILGWRCIIYTWLTVHHLYLVDRASVILRWPCISYTWLTVHHLYLVDRA